MYFKIGRVQQCLYSHFTIKKVQKQFYMFCTAANLNIRDDNPLPDGFNVDDGVGDVLVLALSQQLLATQVVQT